MKTCMRSPAPIKHTQETKRQQLIWLGINRVNYRDCLRWTLISVNLRKPAIIRNRAVKGRHILYRI